MLIEAWMRTLGATSTGAPDHDFLGIEVHDPGIGHCMIMAQEKAVSNLRLISRDAIEVLYHWALDRADCVVTVLTRLDREAPEVESIAPFCVAAEWIEREMWELLGIGFRNHPDLRHLLLADDWPEGKYPLRRDYQR